MSSPTYILRRYIQQLEQDVMGKKLAVQQPDGEVPGSKLLALENTVLVDKASVVQECVDKESVDKEQLAVRGGDGVNVAGALYTRSYVPNMCSYVHLVIHLHS